MTPHTIRAGLIGCGSVSLVGILPHLTEPDARAQIELVALCDVVAERAAAAAARFGVPQAYSDPADLIGRDDVDLVLIATPIPYHYDLAMRALEAGKHVYVQKTMATTLTEARQMIARARERGLTLVASPGQMLAPAMQAMKGLVERGALGKVYWAFGSTAGMGHEYERTRQGDDPLSSIDPTWYYQRGGGPLADMTVYVLHSLTGILGPARRVAALSGIGLPERHWRDRSIPVEMDDNTLALLDFGAATFAWVGGHTCMTGRVIDWGALGIYGSEGTIETAVIEPFSGHPAQLRLAARQPLPELGGATEGDYAPAGQLPYVNATHAAIPEPHVYADIMHCVECIRERKAPIASGEHAAHVIEIVEAAYRAARTGQTQELESRF